MIHTLTNLRTRKTHRVIDLSPLKPAPKRPHVAYKRTRRAKTHIVNHELFIALLGVLVAAIALTTR